MPCDTMGPLIASDVGMFSGTRKPSVPTCARTPIDFKLPKIRRPVSAAVSVLCLHCFGCCFRFVYVLRTPCFPTVSALFTAGYGTRSVPTTLFPLLLPGLDTLAGTFYLEQFEQKAAKVAKPGKGASFVSFVNFCSNSFSFSSKSQSRMLVRLCGS